MHSSWLASRCLYSAGDAYILSVTLSWEEAEIELDPATPVVIAPSQSVMIQPDGLIHRLSDPRPAIIQIDGAVPPTSWRAEPHGL